MLFSLPNEEALRAAAAACDQKGIRNYLFIESDLNDQATAFATEPISGQARKAFKKIQLWTPEHAESVQ